MIPRILRIAVYPSISLARYFNSTSDSSATTGLSSELDAASVGLRQTESRNGDKFILIDPLGLSRTKHLPKVTSSFSITSSSSLPGDDCRSQWVSHIESHLDIIYSHFDSLSNLLQGWTQIPCSVTTIPGVNISTISTSTISNIESTCESITRQIISYVTTEQSINHISTICRPTFFSAIDNQTTTASFTSLPSRQPLPGPDVVCRIPQEHCAYHWKEFKSYFSQYKHFDWTQLWKNFPLEGHDEIFRAVRDISFRGVLETPLQLDEFLNYFKYQHTSQLFGGCPETALDLLTHCVENSSLDDSEVYQYAFESFRQRSVKTDYIGYQNASYQLEELQNILGCDVYVDTFYLQHYQVPKLEHRERDICANSNWGEWITESTRQNNISVIETISSIVLKKELEHDDDYYPISVSVDLGFSAKRLEERTYTGPWTVTSPSLYLAYNTLAVVHPCNWKPVQFAPISIIQLHPKNLSSIVPDIYHDNTERWAYKTKPFNLADLGGLVPEQALSASQFLRIRASLRHMRRESSKNAQTTSEPLIQVKNLAVYHEMIVISRLMNTTFYSLDAPYSPMIALPTQLSNDFGGIFASCRPYSWHPEVDSRLWVLRGVWDPPEINTVTLGLDVSLTPAQLPDITPAPKQNSYPTSISSELSATEGQRIPPQPRITRPPSAPESLSLGDNLSVPQPQGEQIGNTKKINPPVYDGLINIITSPLGRLFRPNHKDKNEASEAATESQKPIWESSDISSNYVGWRSVFDPSNSDHMNVAKWLRNRLLNPFHFSPPINLEPELEFKGDSNIALPIDFVKFWNDVYHWIQNRTSTNCERGSGGHNNLNVGSNSESTKYADDSGTEGIGISTIPGVRVETSGVFRKVVPLTWSFEVYLLLGVPIFFIII